MKKYFVMLLLLCAGHMAIASGDTMTVAIGTKNNTVLITKSKIVIISTDTAVLQNGLSAEDVGEYLLTGKVLGFAWFSFSQWRFFDRVKVVTFKNNAFYYKTADIRLNENSIFALYIYLVICVMTLIISFFIATLRVASRQRIAGYVLFWLPPIVVSALFSIPAKFDTVGYALAWYQRYSLPVLLLLVTMVIFTIYMLVARRRKYIKSEGENSTEHFIVT